MRLQTTKHKNICQINIAPLIDVVFLLIIFFMVVSQFTMQEAQTLNLPEATSDNTTQRSTSIKIIVNVSADGIITFNGQQCTREKLSQYIADNKESCVNILIRADRLTNWEHLRKIMKTCVHNNINNIKVAVTASDTI